MELNKKNIYIGIIGERQTTDELYKIAYETGELIAAEEWVLVCGGMGGIMEAACKGAIENNGTTLGILPGMNRAEANQYLTYSIVSGFFEARNSIVVRSCDVIISIGGSYGTLSEIGFANVYNIPVIGVKSWETAFSNSDIFNGTAETSAEAISLIKKILER